MTRSGLAGLAAVVLLAGCSGGAEPAPSAGRPCGVLPTADAAVRLPSAFPTPDGQVLYREARQGVTRVVFGHAPGESFEAVRDDLAARLPAAGYEVESTDQEAVEAEAHFASGSVRVKQLCDGVVEVRYRLEE